MGSWVPCCNAIRISHDVPDRSWQGPSDSRSWKCKGFAWLSMLLGLTWWIPSSCLRNPHKHQHGTMRKTMSYHSLWFCPCFLISFQQNVWGFSPHRHSNRDSVWGGPSAQPCNNYASWNRISPIHTNTMHLREAPFSKVAKRDVKFFQSHASSLTSLTPCGASRPRICGKMPSTKKISFKKKHGRKWQCGKPKKPTLWWTFT